MRRILLLLALTIAPGYADTPGADSVRGARLFETEHCIECHSLNGKGGHTGPDLGKLIDRDFTPATLASTMWNHAPTMWAAMHARNVQPGGLDEQAAADLFAYFYSARFFEKPGDAGRGKQVFADRSCAKCHGISEVKVAAAHPVNQWEALGDPIALTNAMWNHAGLMKEELSKQAIATPKLSAQELTDLLVYLRNLPATRNMASSFQTSGAENGKALFAAKGCEKCHQGGETPIAWSSRGETLTDVAAAMWNHGLRMPAAAVQLERAEMRDLISYVWATQFFRSDGDPERGKKVFAGKRCSTCHDDTASGAPSLPRGSGVVSGVTMVSALWQHGPAMLDRMREKKIAWPRFEAREMSDLIAYLNQRGRK